MKMNIDELIQSFESTSKNRKERFNDFQYDDYQSFERLINNKKLL